MRIYGDLGSGNCLKVKYVVDHLGLAYEWQPVDIMRGETRTADFLSRFPMGQIPAVEWPDGRRLAQSNAIMRYLARGSSLLPADPYVQARIDEWLFWEQYSHEPYVAVARFQMVYLGKAPHERDQRVVERGEQALDLMERELRGRTFLVGDALTIADVGLLAYTRLASEGGFEIAARQNLQLWIARCEVGLGLSPSHS